MLTLPVTLITTAVLVLWYTFVSISVSFARSTHQVSFGTGQAGSVFNRTVRVHGNAAEYLPLFLFTLALLEYHGLRSEVLYVLAGLFIVGRVLHRSAMLGGSVTKRIWAMQLTLWPLVIGALILLYTWGAHILLLSV